MTVDAVYLYFIMAFSTIYHSIVSDKLMEYGPDKWTMRWTENWLNCWAQKVVIGDTKSSWKPITSGVSNGSVPEPILLNLFINMMMGVYSQKVCRLCKTGRSG